MEIFGFLFFLFLLLILAASLFYLGIKFFLIRMAERISSEIEKSIRASVDVLGHSIEARGLNVRGMSEKIETKAQAMAIGASNRIRAYADQKGIPIEKAKEIFFVHTEKMANLMDSAIKLPLIGGVGLDFLLGFFLPIVGDIVAKTISVLIIVNGIQYGIPKELVSRMVANSFIDLFIGWIPLLGDFIDIYYRANNKNVDLLRNYLEESQILAKASPKAA